MYTMEFSQNNCRICLEKPGLLDWNEEVHDTYGTSTYKICYYKYTQLDDNVADNYSEMLCETCSYELKSFHCLIQKALESYSILQQTCCQTKEIEHKFDTENQMDDEEEFEIVTLKTPTESLIDDVDDEDDDDDKKILQLSCVEALLEIPKDAENEIVGKKSSSEISKDQKRDSASGKHKNKKMKFDNNDDFPDDLEVFIDIPHSDDEEVIDDPQDVTHSDDEEVIDDPQDALSDKSVNDIPHSDDEEVIDDPQDSSADKRANENSHSDDKEVVDDPHNSSVRQSVNRSKRKIMCAYCPKLIIEKHMAQHEQIHEEFRERSEACEICGIKMFSKDAVKKHMKIHDLNRTKKYKCEFCEKSYYDRGGLNVHRRIHLGQLIPCPVCPKEYYRQVDLEKHKAAAHSANIGGTNYKFNKYYVECKDCGKKVVSHHWKHHASLHANEMEMRCMLCDKHFASKLSCHKHVRRVHKYKDEFANVVEYYGDTVGKKTSHLMLSQTETIKRIIK